MSGFKALNAGPETFRHLRRLVTADNVAREHNGKLANRELEERLEDLQGEHVETVTVSAYPHSR